MPATQEEIDNYRKFVQDQIKVLGGLKAKARRGPFDFRPGSWDSSENGIQEGRGSPQKAFLCGRGSNPQLVANFILAARLPVRSPFIPEALIPAPLPFSPRDWHAGKRRPPHCSLNRQARNTPSARTHHAPERRLRNGSGRNLDNETPSPSGQEADTA